MRRIQETDDETEKQAAIKMRETIMPILIFCLQHSFMYVMSEERGLQETKSFFWQVAGIGIG